MKFFYNCFGKVFFSLFLIFAVNTTAKTQPHAPGDIAFTGYHSNPNDKFSFVLLKAFTAGQTINFTDAGWTTASNAFDSDEGLITWTVPAGGLAAGKELTVDAIANTVTLFGGGTAGTITVTAALGLNNGGDQIFAFTGTKAVPTSVLAGLHMNTLSIGEVFDACNTTDAGWDGICATGNNAYSALPSGGGLNTLTGGTNALWIGNIAPSWHEWNNARFNCASVPAATLSTVAGLRAAVNNKANWTFNDDASPNTTLPLPAGCNWLAAICSVTLSSAAGTNAQTVCINTAITNITYSTTSATGATFSGLPAGVTGAWAANVVTISGTPTASGTFNYTVTLTGGVCTSTTATGTITVTAANTVNLTSGAGTNAQTVSVNNPIANITYATTGATGATFSGLPSGVTGGWAANIVTISGSPTAIGAFNYTVTLTGGCGTVTATGSITVNPAACSIILTSAAGTNAQNLCINTAITNITYTTTSATGATFSGLPAGVTGSWAANVVTISGSPSASGTFNYTVTLTGGVCTSTTATGSITVKVNNTITLSSAASTTSQTVTLTAPINNITYSTTSATGASFSGLPGGVTGNWAANVVTISGTPTGTGTFNYTVTLTGGCGLITATGSITVNPSGPPTVLVAGDIAFTGYHAGTAAVDSFSFVLLKAINANTIINFTDNGWLNPGQFRTGEGNISFTSIALPAGSEIVIGGAAGLTARWYNYNCSAGVISAGTVTGTALDLNTGGDQIIAFQGALASPTSLVSMIHMNTYATINFDCGNTVAAGLDPNCIDGGTGTIGNGGFSKLPTGLTIGTNAIWIGDATVAFPAGEYDNAKFNACGLDLSTAALARAAINNQANWLFDNTTPPGFTLPAGCNFLNLCPVLCSLTLTSAAGTNAQTVCINTAITNITYSTTTATGATFSGLPAGVTGAWASNVVTISGTPTASGTFNYTVTLTGGSCSTTANGTITVTAANTAILTSAAGTNAQTVSVNSPITNITYATTGATGATFSGLPSGVTGNWAANVVTISGSPTATGTFNYNVTLTGGCGSVTANGSILVNPAACSIILTSAAGTTSQTVCINTAITNITYTTTGATGATFSGLPAGVTGAWAANVVTISGTPTASGAFNYTVTLTGGPCTTENTTGSITVRVNNTISLTSAGGTNAQTVTLTAPITNITYSTTGATGATFGGLPGGVSGNWAANVVTISGSPTGTGTFNYTVTLTGGCGVITATGSITVNPSGPASTLVAGDIAFTGYHAGTAAVDSFSFVLLKAINANTLINFTDNGWLNPGNFRTGEGNITFTSIALPAGAEIVIGGAAGLTARWNNYNCSGGVISAGTVTGTALDLNTGGDQIIAYQGTLASPTALISIIHMNTYATINFDCGNTVAAGLDPDCIDGGTGTIGNGGFSKLPTGLTIGTNAIWIGDASVAFPLGEYDNAKFNGCGLNLSTAALARAAINNQANWQFDNLTPPGFTLPAGCNFLNLCPVPCSITLSSAAGTDAQTVCINTPITNITYSTTTATGATFSGLPAGVTGAWAANVVTISGTPTASGTFSYTVTLTGGACSTTANGTITVNPITTITLTSAAGTNAQTVCINTPIINITYSTTTATGATFSGLPAGVTGAWAANVVTISGTPTAAGPFSYTINLTGGGGCGTVTATGSITVAPANTITLSSAAGTNAQTVCINTAITNITYTTTGATGATFSGLPAGVTGAWAANVVTISGTPTASGTFNYTVTLTGGSCSTTANGAITVTPGTTITLTSAAGTNAQTVCINTAITNITYSTTTATGATFSGLPTGVTGVWAANVVTISGTPTAAGPFNYTVNLTGGGGCGTITATGSITVSPDNAITLSSAAGTNAQTVCINTPITNITYSTTGATGATFSGLPAGVTGAWAANAVTISGTPTTSVGSPFNYTITLTGGCGAVTATGIITVNPTPDVTQPANQVVCNNTSTAPVNFTGSVPGTIYNWTNNTPSIGLAANGTGNIPSFTALNSTSAPVTATIVVTPTFTSTGGTQTFNYTGAMQTWTVPAGVTSVNISCVGARGGNAAVGGTGGLGGTASGTLAVTPGQVLNIFVGGQNGFNGGGTGAVNGPTGGGAAAANAATGGGASDIRSGGVTLANRLIVAGGGGGAGHSGTWTGCQPAGPGGNGGNGGGLTANDGTFGNAQGTCNCGNGSGDKGIGGSQLTGGAAGGYQGSTSCLRGSWTIGLPGTTGQGGNGSTTSFNGTGGGGGGGGGYFGGGSGGSGSDTSPGGGGGGGSSYIGGVTGGTVSVGSNNGDGQVTITFATSPTCTGAPKTFTITVNPSKVHNLTTGLGYCTIQQAIDAPATLNGHIISVDAGTYVENVIVNKELEIKGASQALTIVRPATSSPTSNSLGSAIFKVAANNVTIHDLTANGKNPDITGAADVDASAGIITDYSGGVAWNNLVVHHVTVQDVYYRGIEAASTVAAISTFNFHHNTVNGVQGHAASAGILNFADVGTIDNNTVSNCTAGINTSYSFGTTISNNNVTGIAGGTGIESDANGIGGVGVADIISGNTVTGGAKGVVVFQPYFNTDVHNNIISGATIGLDLQDGSTGGTATLLGNDIKTNGTGIRVTDAAKLSGATQNFVRNNTGDGIVIAANAGTIGGINNNDLSGNTGFAIKNQSTANIAGTCNWYGTTDPATVSLKLSGPGTYDPFLTNGNDNSSSPGFQPVGGSCNGHLICESPTSQAYLAPTQTGNQSHRGELGMEFIVNAPGGITIKQLGAFDDGGNGITGLQPGGGVRVAIYNRATHLMVPGLDATITGLADEYTGNHRMKNITPVNLPQGDYVIVAKGYHAGERNGNAGNGGGPYPVGDDGGGAISFGFEALYSIDDPNGFGYPSTAVNYGDAHEFLAGAFKFTTVIPCSGTTNCESPAAQSYTSNTQTGNQSHRGELGMQFIVNNPNGIMIKQLGAFDDGANGISGLQPGGGVRVVIYNRSTHTPVPGLDATIVGLADGFAGNHRMKNITPVTLPPGDYVIVAKGYNAGERNGNAGNGGGPYPAGNTGGGAITYGFESSYGPDDPNGFNYPTNFVNFGDSHEFLAGTFTFTKVVPCGGLSNNANLANLVLSQGTLTPAFAAATTSYTASVANSVTSITVTPTAADAGATITVNGTPVASGSPSGSIPLAVGSNIITVLVTAQDGTTTKTYTVNVTRAGPGGCGESSGVQAYGSTTQTGNQAHRGELGMQFIVNNPAGISVKQLGAFDDGGNGIVGLPGGPFAGIKVAIFNRTTHQVVPGLETVVSGLGDAYTGNHRMKTIAPVTLPPGDYVIVAKGYHSGERNGNSFNGGGPYPPGNTNGGAVTFGTETSYGADDPNGFSYPISAVSLTDTHIYLAGTFTYTAIITCATSPVTATTNDKQAEGVSASNPAVIGKAKDLNVYPNPTKGQFTLQVSDVKASDLVIQVINSNGRLVVEKSIPVTSKIASLVVPFNLGNMPSGTYLIKVQSAGSIQTKKFVIQR